ncbi:MAG: glycerophosphodiester phosphodiesterase [Erysipelotrichaceae bacterium]|nr:glycerophosphodiester phosphodiesterase [Erysipelotrichaceae bacterium]
MTRIFGHRGASGYAPENTLESFALAAQQNAEGVELDVQLSRDGEVVVIHDETIDRTSDHQGRVMFHTLEELKSFNFNNHNPDYPFCAIPTLREVFELLKPTPLMINVELKTGIFPYPGIEEKVISLVEEFGMEDRIIYSSFNHYSVAKIRQVKPEAYCGMLHTDCFIDMAHYAREHQMNALHPAFWLLADQNYVSQARDYGLDINSWTINEDEYIDAALRLGINVLITNYPDRALEIRDHLIESGQIR